MLQSCLILCDSMDLAHQASLSHTLTLLLIICLKSSQTSHDPLSPLIQCRCPPTSNVACPLTVQSLHYFILKTHTGDFPGGPVVETLHCPVKKKVPVSAISCVCISSLPFGLLCLNGLTH